MIVRELLARLGFTTDEHSLSKVEETIEGLKESAAQLVELYASWEAAKKLVEMVNQTAELGEETLRTSIKLGIGAEALQEFQFAANQTGTSAESLQAGLRFLSRNAAAAAQGGGEMAVEFSKLGISVTDAAGQLKPVEQLMGEVSDGLKNMQNKTERTAMAVKIFGRGGLEMLPFLVEGSAAIKEQREEAERLGGVMSEDLLETSERYIQVQKKLAFAWRGIQNMLAKSLIPVFESVVDAVKDWLLANRELFEKSIPKAIGYAIRLVKVLADLVATAGRGWVIIVKLTYSMGPAGRAILAVAAAAGILGLAFLSPTLQIGLLIAAVALLVEDFEGYNSGKESVFGHLVEWISGLNKAFMSIESDNPFVKVLQTIDGLITSITSKLTSSEFADFYYGFTHPQSDASKGRESLNQAYSDVAQGLIPPPRAFGSGTRQTQNSLVQQSSTEINVSGVGANDSELADIIARRVNSTNERTNAQAQAMFSSVGKGP